MVFLSQNYSCKPAVPVVKVGDDVKVDHYNFSENRVEEYGIICSATLSSVLSGSSTAGCSKITHGSKSIQLRGSRFPPTSHATVPFIIASFDLKNVILFNDLKTVFGLISGFILNNRTDPSLKYT